MAAFLFRGARSSRKPSSPAAFSRNIYSSSIKLFFLQEKLVSADNQERSGCFAGIFLMEDRGVPAPVRAAAAPHLSVWAVGCAALCSHPCWHLFVRRGSWRLILGNPHEQAAGSSNAPGRPRTWASVGGSSCLGLQGSLGVCSWFSGGEP